MKVAYATYIFVFWLIASIYWNDSPCVCPPTLHALHRRCFITKIKTNESKQISNIFIYTRCFVNVMLDKQPLKKKQLIFFLAANPLQAPLVEKWNRNLPRNKRRKSMDTQSNTQTLCLCRMAYSRSLEKLFDGLKDMETSQNKKRSSSNACLAIVEKSKNKSAAKKYPNLCLGFKAMNALNASKGLEEIAH